jgi:hypothetical protein
MHRAQPRSPDTAGLAQLSSSCPLILQLGLLLWQRQRDHKRQKCARSLDAGVRNSWAAPSTTFFQHSWPLLMDLPLFFILILCRVEGSSLRIFLIHTVNNEVSQGLRIMD